MYSIRSIRTAILSAFILSALSACTGSGNEWQGGTTRDFGKAGLLGPSNGIF